VKDDFCLFSQIKNIHGIASSELTQLVPKLMHHSRLPVNTRTHARLGLAAVDAALLCDNEGYDVKIIIIVMCSASGGYCCKMKNTPW
jgi:hypothetical protein